MNEIKTQSSLNEFLKNPYWCEYYESAPTKACKRYIELEFYYSKELGKTPDYNELKAERDSLEKEFTKVDWAHLYRHCANNPKKVYYRNKMDSCK